MIKDIKFARVSISKSELRDLNGYEKKVDSAKLIKRIHAFKLINKGWTYTEIAKFLNVTNYTITLWIKLFIKGGIKELLNLKYKGSKSKLNKEQIEIVREESKKGTFTFAKDVKNFMEKTFGIKYNIHHILRLLKKNEIIVQKKQY